MAQKFLTPINLGLLELQNARMHNVATAALPAAAAANMGYLVFDSTTKTLKYSDGTQYVELAMTASQIQGLIGNYITKFGNKTGAITLRTGSTTYGDVNLSMNNNELQGTVYLAAWAKKASLAFSDIPSLYIGTTAVQNESKAQALSGITGINSILSFDGTNNGDSVTISKPLKITDTTEYSSSTAASVLVSGGVRIAKKLYVVGDTTVTGAFVVGTASANKATTLNGTLTVGTTSKNAATTLNGTLSATGATTLGSTLSVANAITLSGTTTAKKRIVFNTDATNGDAYIEYDTTNGCFHFSKGLYSDSFVSALGVNSSGGGGGGTGGHDMLKDWSYYTTDAEMADYVISAPLIHNIYTASNTATSNIASLTSRVGTLEGVLNGTDSTKIDTINEVYNFLKDYAQTTDLATLLSTKFGKINVTGSGNAVTSISINSTDKTQLDISKGSTFLTSAGVTANTGSYTFAKWTANGLVSGAGSTLYATGKLNGETNGTFMRTNNTATTFYAPTSVGTDGQVLKSGGSGAPSWVNQSSLSVGTASKLGSNTVGSTTKPIYLNAGTATECYSYAGGTKVTLNGTDKGASSITIFAPTTSVAGDSGKLLVSNGAAAPTWSSITTLKLARIYRTSITGNGTATTFTITHDLALGTALSNYSAHVQIYDKDGNMVMTDIKAKGTSTCEVSFASAPATTDTYYVVVVG